MVRVRGVERTVKLKGIQFAIAPELFYEVLIDIRGAPLFFFLSFLSL